jgi:hypothetical protein
MNDIISPVALETFKFYRSSLFSLLVAILGMALFTGFLGVLSTALCCISVWSLEKDFKDKKLIDFERAKEACS